MKKYLIFFALCLFFGCGAEKTEISVVPESSSEPTGIKIQVKGQSYYSIFYTIELDGCEYFVRPGGYSTLTHKGNCKNHKPCECLRQENPIGR